MNAMRAEDSQQEDTQQNGAPMHNAPEEEALTPEGSAYRLDAASRTLARLVNAQAPGAAPDDWWGLLPLSSTELLFAHARQATLSWTKTTVKTAKNRLKTLPKTLAAARLRFRPRAWKPFTAPRWTGWFPPPARKPKPTCPARSERSFTPSPRSTRPAPSKSSKPPSTSALAPSACPPAQGR